MGTWSTALFGDDIACDVRENYIYYLRSGMSNAAATRQILADYDDELSDEMESVVVWCALAVTQWDLGRPQRQTQKKAVQLIRRGGDIPRWEDEGDMQQVGSRKRVLASIRRKLEKAAPPKKTLRPLPERILPPKRKTIEHHWKIGQVVAYKRECGEFVLLLTEASYDDEFHGQVPYFVVLDWRGKRIPNAERIKKLPASVCVIQAAENQEGESIPWDRIRRLNVKRSRTRHYHADGNSSYGVCDGNTWNDIEAAIDKAFDDDYRAYLKLIFYN